ncbi:alpha/beta fold hydrolase [Advenella kashmirensis]
MSGAASKQQAADLSALTVIAGDRTALNLRTLRKGESDQIPILFIHALAMNGQMWIDVARQLDVTAPIYALDCRGHGDSDHPDGPYSTAQFAQDILSVINYLNVDVVHLAGCSMGGTVSLAFAGLYPERLASLCVIDTTAYYGPDAFEAWEARGQRALNNGLSDLVGFQLKRWFSDNYIDRCPDVIRSAIDVFLKNTPAAYLESCRMLGNADERLLLSRYKGPAAIVVGQDDYATPVSMAKQINTFLTEAELVVLPNLRHYTPIEAPHKIAKIIQSLIDR